MLEGLLTPMHLMIILAIALIVLGPKRLPEAGRGMGEAIRGFKDSMSGSDRAPEVGSTGAGATHPDVTATVVDPPA